MLWKTRPSNYDLRSALHQEIEGLPPPAAAMTEMDRTPPGPDERRGKKKPSSAPLPEKSADPPIGRSPGRLPVERSLRPPVEGADTRRNRRLGPSCGPGRASRHLD